jgi:signal transduction histidine kinase
MNVAVGRSDAVSTSVAFREEYRGALESYISQADEAGLGSAYELGRKALAAGQSLMEIAATHTDVLKEILSKQADPQACARILHASANFFTEALSPYEMAHRGFQEAVSALRQMNERLEEQIKKIAYAVHDDAGQLLVAVHLALATLATQLPQALQEEIVRIEGLLNEVEKQLRQYSHELRPTVLDDLGWLPAIRFLADGVSKRTKLPIHVEADFSERLPSGIEIALYRVVQEALNNAVKHSNASTVSISAKREGDVLRCAILDNGVGFDVQGLRAKGQKRGLGLTAMQERMNAVGASVQIESVPGRGTKLLITLPLEKQNANSSRTRG